MQAGLAAVKYLTEDLHGASALYDESRCDPRNGLLAARQFAAGPSWCRGRSWAARGGARLLGAAEAIATSLGSPVHPGRSRL